MEYARPVYDACFPSGLRVTTLPDRRKPVVSVTTVVDRGQADDPHGREGTTRLLEHLWFRARPGGDAMVRETLREAGRPGTPSPCATPPCT